VAYRTVTSHCHAPAVIIGGPAGRPRRCRHPTDQLNLGVLSAEKHD
jgi:hypothetical protein